MSVQQAPSPAHAPTPTAYRQRTVDIALGRVQNSHAERSARDREIAAEVDAAWRRHVEALQAAHRRREQHYAERENQWGAAYEGVQRENAALNAQRTSEDARYRQASTAMRQRAAQERLHALAIGIISYGVTLGLGYVLFLRRAPEARR